MDRKHIRIDMFPPSSYAMPSPQTEMDPQEFQQILNGVGPKIPRLHGASERRHSRPKVWEKELWQMHSSGLSEFFFPTIQFLKCVLSVRALTLEIWKVPMAPRPLRPQDIACHCGIFSPSESPLESICQSSFLQTFGLLCLHSVGVSELPFRSPMSLRHLARNHLGF